MTTTVALRSAHTLYVTPTVAAVAAVTLSSSTGTHILPGAVPPGLAVLADATAETMLTVQFTDGSFANTDRPTRANSYDVIDRAAPVVLSDVRGSRTGSFGLVANTDFSAAALRHLFANGEPLQWRLHPDATFTGTWFHAAKVTENRVGGKIAGKARVFNVDYTEVNTP